MVYTRWKCDRLPLYTFKYLASEYASTFTFWLVGAYCTFKFCGIISDETEREDMHVAGYPWWRDPIRKRKQDKYVSMIRDNDIDLMDPKWTGVPKSALH